MFEKLSLLKKDVKTFAQTHGVSGSAVLLGLILLLALSLRFYDLGNESYWIDEMSTVVEGQQSISQLMTSGRLDQPPAFYLPFHFWVKIFGAVETGTRSFSALIGVGSIVLLYLIGRRLFGSTVGLFGAFLMAISEFQVYHSQQARFYGFFEFMTLFSFLSFILVLESRRKIDFAFYCLASVLMIYSHAYGLFVIASQAVFLVLQWKKYKDLFAAWVICQVIIVVLVAPYFYPLAFGVGGAVDANIGGLSAPRLGDPLRSVYRFIMSARGERSWNVMLVNYAVALALFAVGLLIHVVRQGPERLRKAAGELLPNLQEIPNVLEKIILTVCWLLGPVMLPFIFSMIIGPMYLDRYTISAAPALYLLIALALFGIRRLIPAIVSLGVLVVMIAPSLRYYYVTDVHEQWREVAEYVQDNSEPGDAIVFAPNLGIGIQQVTFDWYYEGDMRPCSLGAELVNPVLISDALGQCLTGSDRFWVIIRDNQTEPSRRYTSYFLGQERQDMNLINKLHFVEISVYLFETDKP